MTKRSADTTTDDDSGLAWLAFADDRIPGISDDIRQEIYREGAHDEQRVLRWVKSALVLRDLGAVEADVGFFFIAFAAECIAESRIDVDPELCRLDRAKAEIAAANGVDVEEYAFIEAQPPEVRELDLQWNARWKVMEVEILRAAGAHDEAVLRERVFPFDERREAGRRALFGPLDLGTMRDEDDPGGDAPRDPFLM